MPDLLDPSISPVISVSELNARARALIENGLPLAWIGGEISNFTRAASGHCYFSLKDERAQVRCVFFRNRAQLLDWQPTNGALVEVRAVATLYEARGDFQLNVEFMRRAGLGALFEAFERLKRKLEAEGLFASERKRPLPSFPRTVGVVTSTRAAALRDVLTTLRRRMPSIRVIVYPTPVQGEDAARQIAAALTAAGRRAEVDVLILCRGGGSIEDLWSFNDEIVARAIVASPIPVVTGVGHETDFTIADFVSDARAPTPTAAAELVSPDGAALLRRVATTGSALLRASQRGLERRMLDLDVLARRLRHPGERLAQQQERLGQLHTRLQREWLRDTDARRRHANELAHRLLRARPDLERLDERARAAARRLLRALHARAADWRALLAQRTAALEHLNPQAVLERGYGIVRDAQGRVVREAVRLSPGDPVSLTLAHGEADARIEGVRKP
ncbi:MAG: exodeoxyribonuclease VII large subunit [Burkholderiales bacterium]|nr:exodeoxyribonuclease VII large subunit [Burkholderiales bacterium]